MASIIVRCVSCNELFRLAGDGAQTAEDLQTRPHAHPPGSEGDQGCFAKWQETDSARQLAEAQANLASARAQLAAAEAAVHGTDVEGEPHEFTVAELKTLAADKGIDLEDASLKADIRDKVIAGLNVAGLRDFARREGIELHGAQSRAEIIRALEAGPTAHNVTAEEEPTPVFNSGGFGSQG